MGNEARDVMLLSIHPIHAADILDGSKTVELRRTRPSIQPGQLVLLYASSPVCAVVGACRLAGFEIGSTAAIKTKHLGNAAISAADYDNYFRGASRATALLLDRATAMQRPVSLKRLRESSATVPVQSWRFVSSHALDPLLADVDRASLSLLSDVDGSAAH